MRACLAAAGAPDDLVQIVTGYSQTGEAVVDLCDKLIFVGSTKVGKLVMAHAAKTLTPVTLELGGGNLYGPRRPNPRLKDLHDSAPCSDIRYAAETLTPVTVELGGKGLPALRVHPNPRFQCW